MNAARLHATAPSLNSAVFLARRSTREIILDAAFPGEIRCQHETREAENSATRSLLGVINIVMDYATFSTFAVALLSAMTILAYKHHSAYRVLSTLFLSVVACLSFGLFIWIVARQYPDKGVWFFLVLICVGYVWALRFLHLVIGESTRNDGPRKRRANDKAKSQSSDDT